MRNVVLAIIGTGQMGSRHLQSIARLNRDAEIYLVDPSQESLNVAQDRYNQIFDDNKQKFSKKIFLLTDIRSLPEYLDLVIIATTAHSRLQIIESLFKQSKVSNLILEKIVFQKPADFDTAETIFKKYNVKVWVNCPRRFWPGYIHIKEIMRKTRHSYTSMSVTGANWGLCCNSIHFIDLFGFITGEYDLDLHNDQLDLNLVPAKRPGTIEMSGTISGFNKAGGTILIKEYPDADIPLQIIFENPDIRCIIDELSDIIKISRSSNSWKYEEIPLQKLLQSQLTHLYVTEILETGNTRLPTFSESMISHKLLLDLFMNHLSKITGDEVCLCPIT